LPEYIADFTSAPPHGGPAHAEVGA